MLRLGDGFKKINFDADGVKVVAGAAAAFGTLVETVVARGLEGLEFGEGIPGTVGGTPIQNVGAYGQEVAETLVRVTCLDRATLERRTFSAAECEFGYRDSRFKRRDRGRYVVLDVTLRLERDAPPRVRYPELRDAISRAGSLDAAPADAVRLVRQMVLALRRAKSIPVRAVLSGFFSNAYGWPVGHFKGSLPAAIW